MTARFVDVNLLQTPGAVIVPSSELASMPRANLLKPGASVRWRTQSGWTVVLNENGDLQFERGGVKIATIAAGNYPTPTLYAAAVVAALEAADPGQGWACTYSVVTFKFTISATPSFQLLNATPTPDTAHIDLGYASVNTGSATTHTADNVAYQSRHSVNADLGSALAFTSGIVRGHNLLPGGTITMQADVATMAGIGLSDVTTPDFTQVLAGTDPRVAFFASQTKRYLRLIIADVQNPAGYNELGIWWPGTYVQPTICQSINFEERYEPLSEVRYADGGAHHQVLRGDRLVYTLEWLEIEQANIDIFRALNLAMPMGASFFMTIDPDNPTTSTVYGFFRTGLRIPMVFGPYSNVGPLEFAEALG